MTCIEYHDDVHFNSANEVQTRQSNSIKSVGICVHLSTAQPFIPVENAHGYATISFPRWPIFHAMQNIPLMQFLYSLLSIFQIIRHHIRAIDPTRKRRLKEHFIKAPLSTLLFPKAPEVLP